MKTARIGMAAHPAAPECDRGAHGSPSQDGGLTFAVGPAGMRVDLAGGSAPGGAVIHHVCISNEEDEYVSQNAVRAVFNSPFRPVS